VSDLRVRLARPEEYAAVGEVTVAAYREDGYLLGPADPYADHLRDVATRACEAELWVATDNDAVLGAVTFCPYGSPWGELAHKGEGEFRMLAVAPHARGRGVGDALVRVCLDRSRALGYDAVVLSSLPQMTAAHRLYERHGFARQPRRDWTPYPGVELWAFGLALSPAGP